jgi:hypothetical protein
MSSRNILKGWFSIRKKPTETQFADWIDSYFHLTEDTLPIAKINTLQDVLDGLQLQINQGMSVGNIITLPAGTGSFLCEAGKVYDKIAFIDPYLNSDVLIGETVGGEEINRVEVTGGRGSIRQDITYPVATTIYFSGVTANTIIKLQTGI